MKLALCGLPGSGKSTIFSALVGRKITTGKGREETGQALLPVPDERVDKLSAMFNPKKTVYAQVTYLDPAKPQVKPDDPTTKLPPELAQCDGIIEVVRNFDAGMGAPTPQADHQAFHDELILNDLISVERRLERIAQERQRGRSIDQEENTASGRGQGAPEPGKAAQAFGRRGRPHKAKGLRPAVRQTGDHCGQQRGRRSRAAGPGRG